MTGTVGNPRTTQRTVQMKKFVQWRGLEKLKQSARETLLKESVQTGKNIPSKNAFLGKCRDKGLQLSRLLLHTTPHSATIV